MPPAPQTGLPTWHIGPISTPSLRWGERRAGRTHECQFCGVVLLTGERADFCCGKRGSRLNDVPPLPPLPHEYLTFINSPNISSMSRILNLMFSFASLESTHVFPDFGGLPGFMAIQGKIYHRVRPDHRNSAVRWLLYDGNMQDVNEYPHERWSATIPAEWIAAVRTTLMRVNPFVHHIRILGQLNPVTCPNASLTLADSGSAEIAAVMDYDNTTQNEVRARTIVISRVNGQNQRVATVSRMWEPLSYPLLFPEGTLGWGVFDDRQSLRAGILSGDDDACTTQIWHYRARLLREPRFRIFGRLTNEYLVDMFSRHLDTVLNYIRGGQMQRRVRENDAELMGDPNVDDSDNVYLPASFLGSRRWAQKQVSDSLAIAAALGNPTFFVTMTCNAQWREIQSQLRPGQDYTDIPLVVVRVFKQKLSLLLTAIKTMFPNAGAQVYCLRSTEFQKRGMPHTHMLIRFEKPCLDPNDIDDIVSAEMPTNVDDAALVRKFMMHNHPPADRPASKYCQKQHEDGTRTCRFHYPHPLQQVTTVDAEGRVHYRRRKPGDEMVVPHCLPLIKKFECHINFEVANTSHLFQYIFKYIHKGPDRTRYKVSAGSQAENQPVDEIEDYYSARYLSAGEAAWRILGFKITRKDPAVTAVSVHLPGTNTYRQYSRSTDVGSLSSLERYFLRPAGSFTVGTHIRHFRDLTFAEYFSTFRLEKYNPANNTRSTYFRESHAEDSRSPEMHVILRNASHRHLSRIDGVRPSQGELFYLRRILQHRSALSFEDARTVGERIFETYQEAATEMGLFADENEGIYALKEAIETLRTPRQLRILLVHLLVNDLLPTPINAWNDMHEHLALDFTLRNGGLVEIGVDHALQELATYLEEYGKRLSDYGLPEPESRSREVEHELVRWGGNREMLAARADRAYETFNDEQKEIYDEVIHAVIHRMPLLMFIDGKAGRGKTFLVCAIIDKIRSMGRIALPTATAAFAAQLYPGGRTTHSAFKVPVNEKNEMLQSPIKAGDSRSDLIREAAVVAWDEAPMVNRAVLACVEETSRRVMDCHEPFGNKIILLMGDFRQTCPVIRRGTKAQVVNASIKSSPLWPLFKVRTLTQPIRNAADLEFAKVVDAIGDGAGPDIRLDTMLDIVTDPEDLMAFVYPPEVLRDSVKCLKRSILCPTNIQVDFYNDTLLKRVEGVERTYHAADSLKEVDEAGLVTPDSALDYVARHPPPGFPHNKLIVKTGGVYRLMRNMSIDRGLVKNVRVVVVGVGNRIITVRLLKGVGGVSAVDSDDILLPRISFVADLTSGHTLLRKQFPLAPAYATTFNSCQGLTLDSVGVDLTRPVFSHGQLYTALSRIRHRTHAKVRLRPGEIVTQNVTYHDILV